MSRVKEIEPLNLSFGEAVKAVSQGEVPRQQAQTPRIVPTGERNIMRQEEQGRVWESDLVLPSLRVMSERPDVFISTTELIQELEELFNPTGKDAELIDGRSDTFFSQKVRNLISHKDSPNNMIAKGYAEHDAEKEGLRITNEGRAFLASLSD